MSQYSTDPSRVYLTGNSMGGIGTWDLMIKYNAIDGTNGKIFAAGMPLAGSTYDYGYPTPDPSVVAELKNVPIWAIHGAQDDQVPPAWDEAMASALSGSSTFHYTEDPNLGHDVWDTYYPLPYGKQYWDWLFSQRAPGSSSTPPGKPSPNDTVVKAGSSADIADASGNTWAINNGQVAVNGSVDTSTVNVSELAYVNGTVWQENASDLWWGKTSPGAAWSPTNGTSANPLPATGGGSGSKTSANDTVVKAGSGGTIVDAAGNKWSGTSAGQVAVNGVTDQTTAKVAELAYVNGAVWQENSGALWWSKTSPGAAWSPASGTATSPLPAPVKTSANDTVVMAGSAGAIIDASNNKWTINNGQVAVNGASDASTANVSELAYVNGSVWQENAGKLWWGKTSPSAPWSPTNGTSTSPLPGSSSKPAASTSGAAAAAKNTAAGASADTVVPRPEPPIPGPVPSVPVAQSSVAGGLTFDGLTTNIDPIGMVAGSAPPAYQKQAGIANVGLTRDLDGKLPGPILHVAADGLATKAMSSGITVDAVTASASSSLRDANVLLAADPLLPAGALDLFVAATGVQSGSDIALVFPDHTFATGDAHFGSVAVGGGLLGKTLTFSGDASPNTV
ncbi:MAG: hypothetical protein M3Y35_12025, partial [Actinomycetota bacterium]|nr:hypothetical protein [Actinomycetota bacterium]